MFFAIVQVFKIYQYYLKDYKCKLFLLQTITIFVNSKI